ncbi:hypothetical protein H4C80_04360 [Pseudomonas juntendi]|uniref:Uncharacterized protein n=1 Tax=Pseudomonas juntendi TaxID=2666183 RepID=A0A7W2KD74_9PSED|nr:hypothetical protein [Pseudomonas juntendi]MBA6096379.1 hypothetical protein [Pseudomonas juntendi]
MSITRAPFFANDARRQIVTNALTKIRGGLDSVKDSEDVKLKFMLDFIALVLGHLQRDPRLFDQKCIMNIAAIGEKFMDELLDLNLSRSEIETLFASCYRFLVEFQLSTPGLIASDLLYGLERVSDFEYEGIAGSQVRYAGQQMLVNVVQHYLYHPSLVELKDLPSTIERSEKERQILEETIGSREARVQALADKLKTYETAFNFVGLYAGFQGMKTAKVVERRWNFGYLILLGFLLLLPFAVKVYLMYRGEEGLKFDTVGLATLAGLELLLLYFFRVALQNFKSIKAQLLQIDLRMTLCQFVQSYAEYSKDARSVSPGLLERFEQVVFSGIVNDESAIPSTFDGLDKLAELVGRIRK